MWLLILLLLGSTASAPPEFGFVMARISPEASATDHDPCIRRDGSRSASLLDCKYASVGLRVARVS